MSVTLVSQSPNKFSQSVSQSVNQIRQSAVRLDQSDSQSVTVTQLISQLFIKPVGQSAKDHLRKLSVIQ